MAGPTAFPASAIVSGTLDPARLPTPDLSGVVQVADKDQPGGVVGINEDGTIDAIVSVRKGTAAELNGLVLRDGEIAIEEKAGYSPTFRVGDGISLGGKRGACSVVVVDGLFSIEERNAVYGIGIGKASLNIVDNQNGEEFLLNFPSIADQSCFFSFPTLSNATVAGVTIKTTTGDNASNITGEIVINTFDNNIKMYADAGWRTLASW